MKEQVKEVFPQGEGGQTAEKVWYCTEKSKCKWQGFALNAGLSWGEIKNTTPEWQKYHSQFCKGTLVQGVITDQHHEALALKEQMERVTGKIDRQIDYIKFSALNFKQNDTGKACTNAILGTLENLKAELEG